MENKNTILVVGQAKPSKEDAIYNLHGEFYISLIVERDTGKILELDCNTILGVTKQFVASMFVGKSLRTDVPLIEKEIRERYFALTQKPATGTSRRTGKTAENNCTAAETREYNL